MQINIRNLNNWKQNEYCRDARHINLLDYNNFIATSKIRKLSLQELQY